MSVYFLTVLESENPRSRCQRDWFLRRTIKKDLFQAAPWLVHMVVFFRCFHITFPLLVFLSTSACSCKDASYMGLGLILRPLLT